MKKGLFGILVLLFVFGLTHDLEAKKRKKKNLPESEPIAETVPASEAPSSLGLVKFYLDRRQNPESQPGSVHVGERDRVFFCVKVNPEDPRVARVMKYLRGVGVTLEGPGENPQKLSGVTRFRKRLIEPELNGCFLGGLKVPYGVPPGKYKVSELDLWEAPSKAVSLREELKEFSPLGVIEVESPNIDTNPPIIESISSFTPEENHLHFGGHIASATMRFRVFVTDFISGVQPDSFKIFFKVFLDNLLVDIVEPQCKPHLKKLYYECRLRFSRSQPDLRAVTAKFVLDSMSVADRLGNDIEIRDVEKLKALFEGDRLTYTFYPTVAMEKKSRTSEKKEEDLVEWPPVVKPPLETEGGDLPQ